MTNGLLLPRWGERLWPALAASDTCLTISIHSDEPDYRQRLDRAVDAARAAAAAHRFVFELRDSVRGWYRLYRGAAADIRPFDDGDPRASWRVCQNKHCVTLLDNTLWKCPPLAHLPRVAAKLRLVEADAWRTALAYRPLDLAASDDDVRAFFAEGPIAACGMCPSRLDYFVKSI